MGRKTVLVVLPLHSTRTEQKQQALFAMIWLIEIYLKLLAMLL